MLKKMKRPKLRNVNFKATENECEAIQAKADQHCREEGRRRGNLSEWVRHAALNYEPSAEEIDNGGTDGPK